MTDKLAYSVAEAAEALSVSVVVAPRGDRAGAHTDCAVRQARGHSPVGVGGTARTGCMTDGHMGPRIEMIA